MGRGARSGVALLEMMGALAVMALTAVVVADAFGFFGRALSGVDRLAAPSARAMTRHQVRSWAQAVSLSPEGLAGKDRFVGEPDFLRLFARLGAPWDDKAVVTATLDRGSQDEARWSRWLAVPHRAASLSSCGNFSPVTSRTGRSRTAASQCCDGARLDPGLAGGIALVPAGRRHAPLRPSAPREARTGAGCCDGGDVSSRRTVRRSRNGRPTSRRASRLHGPGSAVVQGGRRSSSMPLRSDATGLKWTVMVERVANTDGRRDAFEITLRPVGR